jgi:hypothetical protein
MRTLWMLTLAACGEGATCTFEEKLSSDCSSGGFSEGTWRPTCEYVESRDACVERTTNAYWSDRSDDVYGNVESCDYAQEFQNVVINDDWCFWDTGH